MKYKTGDKVRVRTDIKSGEWFGQYYFKDEMQRYAGKIVTIRRYAISGDGYDIIEDSGAYVWTDRMFDSMWHREASEPSDAIKPNYYQFHGYDVFDIAEHFGLSFPLGNALKYLLRCKHKENEEQDLRKAIKCIERHLEMVKRDKQKLASDIQNVGD